MQYRQKSNPRRHMLSQSHSELLLSHAPVIKDRAELQLRLQEAIALEHFTIPPYLFALYSLIDGKMGPNKEAYHILLSVAMEEMLHMIMAANILSHIPLDFIGDLSFLAPRHSVSSFGSV